MSCQHCGGCEQCERCLHCGHCKKCGKAVLPYYPWPYYWYYYQPQYIPFCGGTSTITSTPSITTTICTGMRTYNGGFNTSTSNIQFGQ